MSNTSDQQLAVLSFDSELRAQEFLTATARLQAEGKILVRDAVFVTKHEDGTTSVIETTDPTPGASALSAGAWGLLFGAILAAPITGLVVGAGAGALLAKLHDTGVPDDFVEQVRDAVGPGRTALALLVSHTDGDAVLAELGRFRGAQFMMGTLSPESVAAVQSALYQTGGTN